MDDPIRNDSLKSSDRLKQEANDLAYCEVCKNILSLIRLNSTVQLILYIKGE